MLTAIPSEVIDFPLFAVIDSWGFPYAVCKDMFDAEALYEDLREGMLTDSIGCSDPASYVGDSNLLDIHKIESAEELEKRIGALSITAMERLLKFDTVYVSTLRAGITKSWM